VKLPLVVFVGILGGFNLLFLCYKVKWGKIYSYNVNILLKRCKYMTQEFKQVIESLEKKLCEGGLGILVHRNRFLLTPEEALIYLEEIVKLNIDLAVSSIDLWTRTEDDDYYESPNFIDYFDDDGIENFVEYTYLESRKYVETLIGDKTIDRLIFCFKGMEK